MSDSDGAAQVGTPDASAPVRVLSEGDDVPATTEGPTAPGEQTVDGSTGGAQVGSPAVTPGVRVLSDGDDEQAPSGGGSQTAQDTTGGLQVGSARVRPSLRVAGAGDSRSLPAATESVFTAPAPTGGEEPGDTGTADRDRGATPGNGAAPGNTGATAPGADGAPGALVPAALTRTVADGGLPHTGLALMWLVALGLAMLAGGAALRRTGGASAFSG